MNEKLETQDGENNGKLGIQGALECSEQRREAWLDVEAGKKRRKHTNTH